MSQSGLAGLLAEAAVAAASDSPAGRCRLAVDGPVLDDAAALADAVAVALTDRAVPVARVRAGDWLRARSLRLELGRADPRSYLEGWFDAGALRREVLDPLGRPGPSSWLPRLRDPQTDRSSRQARREAPPGLVAVLDIPFLTRWQTRDAVDLLVLLDVSPAARTRRMPHAEQARALPAWQDYLDVYLPEQVARFVVRYDHPGSPALVER